VCFKKMFPQVALKTVGQSANPKWFEERRYKVSGTSCHDAIRAFRTGKLSKSLLIKLSANRRSIASIPAVNYGRVHEPDGIEAAKRFLSVLHPSAKFFEVGFFPHKQFQTMGASPDLLYTKTDDGPIHLVEVKCPYSARCSRNVNECNINFLNRYAGLKYNSPVHAQIQMQLLCTGAESCLLFVFSPATNHILSGLYSQFIFPDPKFFPPLRTFDRFIQNTLIPAALKYDQEHPHVDPNTDYVNKP